MSKEDIIAMASKFKRVCNLAYDGKCGVASSTVLKEHCPYAEDHYVSDDCDEHCQLGGYCIPVKLDTTTRDAKGRFTGLHKEPIGCSGQEWLICNNAARCTYKSFDGKPCTESVKHLRGRYCNKPCPEDVHGGIPGSVCISYTEPVTLKDSEEAMFLLEMRRINESSRKLMFENKESSETTYRKAAIATVNKLESILKEPAYKMFKSIWAYEEYLVRHYQITKED